MTKEEEKISLYQQEQIASLTNLIAVIKMALADFKSKPWWMKVLTITDLINKLLAAINDHKSGSII